MAHSKLIFRAVLQNDLEYLKTLLEDDQHIHSVSSVNFSVAYATHYICLEYKISQY